MEWISVKERLPEIVYKKKKCNCVFVYQNHPPSNNIPYRAVTVAWLIMAIKAGNIEKITHWQYAEPPKE